MIGCLIAFIPTLRAPTFPVELLIFGLGVFIVCSRISEYLETFSSFYTLIITLQFAILKICRYTISVLPIFLAFAVLGTLLFGPFSDKYSNFGSTVITLYALVTGDSTRANFEELDASYPFVVVSRIYLFVVSFLAIVAFLNVYIFIMGDAYHMAKLVSARYHKDYEGLPGTVDTVFKDEWRALLRTLDVEKLFLAIDLELEPLTYAAMEEENGGHVLPHPEKNPIFSSREKSVQNNPRIEDLPPELLFVDGLRRSAIHKAELSRTSLRPNSTQMTGYVPLHRKVSNNNNRNSVSDEEDSASDVFLRIFDKHKQEFEKNFDKNKQMFLENLRKDLLQLTRNSIQSVREPSVIPPDETSVAEDSSVEPQLPRLGIFPPGSEFYRRPTGSSRTEDSARSRTTVTQI